MHALITGSAGFIGYSLARRLLEEGHAVVGLDAFTSYYDPALKIARTELLRAFPRFEDHRVSIADVPSLAGAWAGRRFDAVIHLAAQAGVRHSLRDPRAYLDANVVGTFNVLEQVRMFGAGHLLLASTSSVYGSNTALPFRETDRTDHPTTFYAATKKAAEAMAHCYAHLWAIPTTAFRFFTVYGPWGRPDMAPMRFATAILEGRPLALHNGGDMRRDFTFVDDIVEAVVRLIGVPPDRTGDPALGEAPDAPFRVVNIGAGAPIGIGTFVAALERRIGRPALVEAHPMDPGEVVETFASADVLARLTAFRPRTPLDVGVDRFVSWLLDWRASRAQAGATGSRI